MATPRPRVNAQTASPHVAIIGAGFSGIALGIALKQAGHDDFVIYEADEEVGGTWRDNTYPGCACDVPSHLYSYSFEPKPDWQRDHGTREEIFEYLRTCTDKYGLAGHLRFRAKVVDAELDEAAGLWTLSLASGEKVTARVVVSATGPLSRPRVPELPGRDRFRGPQFHSARWDHDFDARGKVIASIGTGASAVQYVPELAKVAKKLYVVQRTPPWILPKEDAPISEKTRERFRRYPILQRAFRDSLYWRIELRAAGFVFAPSILKLEEALARRRLARDVRDPALRRALRPRYDLGCKRVLFSDDYYDAIQRPNVELVPSPATALTDTGVALADGRTLSVDGVVYGTGFDVGKSLVPGAVRGLRGRDLNRAWEDGLEGYYGVAFSGFPNFFAMLGPNSGVGHTSMIFMIEAQARYILRCIEWLREDRLRLIDVVPEAQRRHNDALQARMVGTVWSSGCTSWYRDARGKNVALWPGFTFEYWLRTRRPNRRHFRTVSL